MSDVFWAQIPLFGDDRLRAEVRFSELHGWQHELTGRFAGEWTALSVGVHRSWNNSVDALAAAVLSCRQGDPG